MVGSPHPKLETLNPMCVHPVIATAAGSLLEALGNICVGTEAGMQGPVSLYQTLNPTPRLKALISGYVRNCVGTRTLGGFFESYLITLPESKRNKFSSLDIAGA